MLIKKNKFRGKRDCDNWRKELTHPDLGKCNRLTYRGNVIELAIGAESIVDTPRTFGCVYFLSRPKGQFKIECHSTCYHIRDIKTAFLIGHWHSHSAAIEALDWLNKRWERRE